MDASKDLYSILSLKETLHAFASLALISLQSFSFARLELIVPVKRTL